MSTHSQNLRILSHLKAGNTITRAEALNKLGIANLTARVAELRQDGQPIADEWIEEENRYGETVRFKRYRFDRKKRRAAS